MLGSQFVAPLVTAIGMKGRRRPAAVRRLSPVQAVVIGYAALMLLGTGLLLLPLAQRPGIHVNWLQALFTAVSATTLTGLVTVSTADTWSAAGQCIILALVQLGAVGYVTFASIIATLLGIRLGLTERYKLWDTHGNINRRDIFTIVRFVVLLTLAFELFGTLLLALHFHARTGLGWAQSAWEGFFYAVSAFCNAGFDLAPGMMGLAYHAGDSGLLIVLGLLIIFGGLGFGVLAEFLFIARLRRFTLHGKLALLMTVLLIVVGTGLVLLFEWRNTDSLGSLPTMEKYVNAWFMAVTPRTGGFSPLPIDQLTPPTQFVLGLLMFIGASPDSTGGGIKTTTFAIILLAILTLLRQRPDIEAFRRRISGELVRLSLSLVTMYLLAILLVIIAISLTEITLNPAMSPVGPGAMMRFGQLTLEVISAFGTVGLSAGITSTLKPLSQLLIIVSMCVGRLGPLIFVYIFAGAKHPLPRRLPNESVLAG